MRVGRPCLTLIALLIPASLCADDHRADRFGGLSYGRGSSLFGIHLTDAVTFPGMRDYDISFFGDLSALFGSESGNRATRVTYTGGIRWTIADDVEDPKQQPKFLPFVQGSLGGVYNHVLTSENDLALGLGAGFDYVPDRAGTRKAWAIRVQADYFITGGEDFPRVSAGLVYRFPR